MRTKKLLYLVLAVGLLLALPVDAMAKTSKASIKLNAKVGLLYENDTYQLKLKLKNVKSEDVSFASSNDEIATVSEDGKIEAVNVGLAKITASGGGAKAKCVTVVLPKEISVKAGETVKLPYMKGLKYKSKSSAIASVNKKGVITGKKSGATAVVVKYGKKSLKILVDVEAGENSDAGQSKAAALDAAGETDQIVLVEYTGGTKAKLSVHEKVDGAWRQRFETTAYVGKNGIDKTKEGDKKTPTGTFNLTTPFGIKADPGAKQDYTKVTKYHYWCGSSDSEYYNQLVDTRENDRACTKSDEHLIDYKGVYNYAMFIDYNADGEAGKGSCIFLHCKGSKKYTAGCIAVSESAMKKIIQWADDGAMIVIKKA